MTCLVLPPVQVQYCIPYHSNQNPRWTPNPCILRCVHTIFGSDYYECYVPHKRLYPCLEIETMYTNVESKLSFILGTKWGYVPSPMSEAVRHARSMGDTAHSIQNPRWTQKPCIPVCFTRTILGSDYCVNIHPSYSSNSHGGHNTMLVFFFLVY